MQTMTKLKSDEALPADFDLHRAELAALPTKVAQARYACEVLGTPNAGSVSDFLEAHGAEVGRSTVFAAVSRYRDANGQLDTGAHPVLTDDVIARMDAERADRIDTETAIDAETVVADDPPAPAADIREIERNVVQKATARLLTDLGLDPAAPATGEPVVELDRPEPESAPESETEAEASVSGQQSEPIGRVESDPPMGPDSALDSDEFDAQSGPDSSPEVLDSALDSARTDLDSDPAPVFVAPIPVTPEPEPEPVAWTQPAPVRAESNSVRAESGPVLDPVLDGPDSRSDRVASPAEDETVNPWWVSGACYAVAVATLPLSLNTSWRFFERVMHITDRVELIGMAAVMEMALLVCGIGMAANVRKTGSPGAFRLVVWGICGFAGWTAWHMSDTLGESLARVILGPVLGAIMLHLALGLVRRNHHKSRDGVLARLGRELRERALSRLGLADDERTAAQRTRDRAATRAVALSMPSRFRFGRRARLQRALLAAGVADDPQMMARMMARRRVVHRADELAGLDQGSPWT
ncbi:hypothetical protein [Nocardia fluminea]|uniref:hypothetical protein n=1 Tax=Nocardia fluminea TaxID=134984 RepID=UPI0036528647